MISFNNYGKMGAFLESRGWVIKASASYGSGTAQCDCANRTIRMKPSAFDRPNVRIRRYVVPHELWHAVHCELTEYDVDLLMAARNLDRRSAIEVVADAACLVFDKSRTMRNWVYASVVWHGRVGYKYRWRDVISPEATTTVFNLRKAMDEAISQGGAP